MLQYDQLRRWFCRKDYLKVELTWKRTDRHQPVMNFVWNVSQIVPEWQSFRKLHLKNFENHIFLTTRVWSCPGCWTQMPAKLKVGMDVWTNEWSSVFWNVSQKVKHDRPTSTTGYLYSAYIGAVIEHKCTAMTTSIGSDRWFRTMTKRNLF